MDLCEKHVFLILFMDCSLTRNILEEFRRGILCSNASYCNNLFGTKKKDVVMVWWVTDFVLKMHIPMGIFTL